MDDRPEQVSDLRLKYFLARRIERRGKGGANVTPQQAAILAALMWAEHYAGGPLNQKRLCLLLGGIKETLMTKVMGEFERKRFVERAELVAERGNYYRVTTEGRVAVARFADEVLGIPKDVDGKLRQHGDYASVIAGSHEYIDEFLRLHFTAAKQAP